MQFFDRGQIGTLHALDHVVPVIRGLIHRVTRQEDAPVLPTGSKHRQPPHINRSWLLLNKGIGTFRPRIESPYGNFVPPLRSVKRHAHPRGSEWLISECHNLPMPE